MKRKLGRGIEFAIFVLLVAILAGQVLGQPLAVGFVRTHSMEPTLEAGDGFVAVPPQLVGDIDEGTVVTFEAVRLHGGGLTTHRIAEKTRDGYVTRGDANVLTDQQGIEPPVSRDRIVAVALQVNGNVVVIPHLGSVTEASQQLFAAAGNRLGFGGSPRELATILLSMVTAAYLLDRLVAGSEDDETSRTSSRDLGYDAVRLVGLGVVVVVLVATLSMASTSGTTTVRIDSVTESGAADGGIVAGTTRRVPVKLSNPGVVPTVAVLDSPASETSLTRDTVVVGPREQVRVNVSVTAPTEPGRYEYAVVRHNYIGVLPAPVLRAVSRIHPVLGIVAVDAFVAIVLLVSGRLLLGGGRFRRHGGHQLPVRTVLRRGLRRLYRRRRSAARDDVDEL
ncbi:MAG: S26 family signal peptidase [Haloarculaceae archaeon]